MVYIIWDPYLAIRFSVETIPPFFSGGARFLGTRIILFVQEYPVRSQDHSAGMEKCVLRVCATTSLNILWTDNGFFRNSAVLQQALLVALEPLLVLYDEFDFSSMEKTCKAIHYAESITLLTFFDASFSCCRRS